MSACALRGNHTQKGHDNFGDGFAQQLLQGHFADSGGFVPQLQATSIECRLQYFHIFRCTDPHQHGEIARLQIVFTNLARYELSKALGLRNGRLKVPYLAAVANYRPR